MYPSPLLFGYFVDFHSQKPEMNVISRGHQGVMMLEDDFPNLASVNHERRRREVAYKFGDYSNDVEGVIPIFRNAKLMRGALPPEGSACVSMLIERRGLGYVYNFPNGNMALSRLAQQADGFLGVSFYYGLRVAFKTIEQAAMFRLTV